MRTPKFEFSFAEVIAEKSIVALVHLSPELFPQSSDAIVLRLRGGPEGDEVQAGICVSGEKELTRSGGYIYRLDQPRPPASRPDLPQTT